MDWFKIGKGVRQGCILSRCLFNLYAEYIMGNPGLTEAQAGIKIAGRYTYLWLIHVDVWQNSTKFCKANIFQLKNE